LVDLDPLIARFRMASPGGSGPRAPEEILRILVTAVEQSPVSVIITDPNGIIEYVNAKFTQVTGYSAEEAIGKTPRIIKGGFLPGAFYKDLWQTILAGEEWHGVFHNRTKAGDLVWEVASISPIRDEHGAVTHFVGVKEDITELKQLQGQLEHMARHDQLTGLPNRFLFQDRLSQALVQSRRRGSQFAVMYMDLDEFKKVNDTHGHETGDALLVAAGERMQRCIRESDTLARLGGDEFALLLWDLKGPVNASRIAEALVQTLSEPFELGSSTCRIGVSIGISLYPRDGETSDQLLSSADAAMYDVKRGGRGGHRFAFR
jgi:diguanylate cyclase (GGDEF)-like protein/PAS domain S-box-containing protein